MDLDAVLARLDAAGVWLDPGLTDDEVADVERRFGFTFCADHRAMLTLAVPIGDGWPDWLDDDESPSERSWRGRSTGSSSTSSRTTSGRRPGVHDRPTSARRRPVGTSQTVPTMVPVYSHRYLPSGPAAPGTPVFSIYQTDVIHYGSDLADYLERELLGRSSPVPAPDASLRVPFWSDLVDGVDPADL